MLTLTPVTAKGANEKLPEVATGLFDNNTSVTKVIEWINAQTLSTNPFVIALIPLGEENQHVERQRTKTVKGKDGAPDTQITRTQKVYLGGNVEAKSEGKAKVNAVDLPARFKDSDIQLSTQVFVTLDEDSEGAEE